MSGRPACVESREDLICCIKFFTVCPWPNKECVSLKRPRNHSNNYVTQRKEISLVTSTVSLQGRLCRSRHSSGVGVGPYRYANVVQSSGPAGGGAGGGLSALNVTPYSPMALNNLNNPYSPQPATPVSTTCPDDMFVTYVQGGANTNVHDGATVVVQGANGNNVMATQVDPSKNCLTESFEMIRILPWNNAFWPGLTPFGPLLW